MIEKLIAASARNKFLVFLVVGLLSIWGIWALKNIPLDAIPDLSDAQVIVFTDWPGRSPDLVEDQITYPIASSLLATPGARVTRGYSFFGLSFVYVIFDDSVDIYWARSRILEYLSKIQSKLPPGVAPSLGPDATGVGWVYQYALVDKSGKKNLADLRSLQDWYLKYSLEAVPGVAEVATIGGHVKEYQITVDPNRLLSYDIPLMTVSKAVRESNRDVGGRVVEFSGREYMVKGEGYIKSVRDIEQIAIGTDSMGTPVLLKDVAEVAIGPAMRRGVGELDGEGEVVGGVVVMRYGENALNVIRKVKEQIERIKPSLPEGVEIVTTYDRSDLIIRAIETLRDKLVEESIIVSLVCIIFLFHFRSALVAILTLPIAIILSFIGFHYLKLTSNIMSLGGIAIAIGAMVDAAIVMVENAHKALERNPSANRTDIIVEAAIQVGKPLFYSLLVITVSFMPVFTLEAQEGRLFRPLAFTKTLAMFFASFLSVTLVPVLMVMLIKGKIAPEEKNPITRMLVWLYRPVVKAVLRFRVVTIIIAVLAVAATVPIFNKLGSEFMPALNEGAILDMPTSLPGISVQEATRSMIARDREIKKIPEVAHVHGKVGRASTPTDPAPLSMIETVITLKPESEWREGMTFERLQDEIAEKVNTPGWTDSWTQPIKNRIDMLSTGIKTAVGVKVYGRDLKEMELVGRAIEQALLPVRGTRSVYAERAGDGYYLDVRIKREAIARYGLTVEDVNMVIESAVGGMKVTTTVEGRERYPVIVRYPRRLRTDLESLRRVLVSLRMSERVGNMSTMSRGNPGQVPLGELVDFELRKGPGMIKEESGMLVSYVYVDIGGRDVGGYVQEARRVVAEKVDIPAGISIRWSGQYEYMERAKEKLTLVVPLTALLIFVLLYFNFRSVSETMIVMLSVPFAAVGGIWILYWYGFNMSVAVWVGLIALAGVAAETGVVMIVYLDEAFEEYRAEGRMKTLKDLHEAVMEGAVQRVRPKMMTVTAIIAGLLPIMWSHGAGADVMKRIAAPMVGGMVTSTVLTLCIIPAIYSLWRARGLDARNGD